MSAFAEPVIFDFYLGVSVTLCPPGVAAGAMELRTRGHSMWPEITCWPKYNHFPLWDGLTNDPRPVIRVRGMRLWNQEVAVYLTERKSSIGAMIEELGLSHMLPRVGGFENILTPRPEDFELFGERWQCCRCQFKWIRRKGDSPREYCPHCYCGWWQFPPKDIA